MAQGSTQVHGLKEKIMYLENILNSLKKSTSTKEELKSPKAPPAE